MGRLSIVNQNDDEEAGENILDFEQSTSAESVSASSSAKLRADMRKSSIAGKKPAA